MRSGLIEIARRYMIEVLEEGDLDVLPRLVRGDFVRRDPLCEVSGTSEVAAYLCNDAFSDVCIVIDDMIAGEDQVVVRYTWYALHRGEFLGFEPTDKRVKLPMIEILRFDRNLIAEAEVQFDMYALFEQLGMLPRPWQLAPPKTTRPMLRLVR